jgi:lipopolysaccharide biosynthesis regulator YciM
LQVLIRSSVARLCAVSTAVFSLISPSAADAQRGAPRPCTAPATILIAWPKAPDKKAALEIRDKMFSTIKDELEKELCLVSREQMTAYLSGSRYPTDSTLPLRDWIQLATVLRGDEVLEIEAKPAGKGYELAGRLTLIRDESMRDSIPHIAAGELSQATKSAAIELRKLLVMLSHEAKCYRLGREGNFAAAEAAGRAALAAYPGNIARLCLATSLRLGKKSPEEVVTLSEEVRKTDPTNLLALLNLLNTYYEKGDQAKYAEVGTAMLSIDPASQHAETIIANLASWKQTDAALKLLEKSLQDDPDNVNLRQIDFRLVYSTGKVKEAQKRGEALAKLDSASVDTAFVMKMVSAYASDSQPQKAAEWLERGAQKFPDNITMSLAFAQSLRQNGHPARAIDEYKRIIKLNPDAARGTRLYIARAYTELGQPDSAAVWARRAVDAGDDKTQASGVVLQIGSALLQTAQTTHSPDDFKKIIPYVAYSDSVAGNDLAKFVWGYSALQIATAGLMQMQTPAGQTCAIAKETRAWLSVAAEKVLQGARADTRNAPGLLQTIPGYIDGVDRVIAQLRCQ